MTITEAAACGTPAVATRIAGHIDAIVDGRTGLLVDDPAEMGSAIERLIGDARGIRYPMLTLSESDLPKKRKLAALRSVYVPCVNRYRDGAVQLRNLHPHAAILGADVVDALDRAQGGDLECLRRAAR